MRERYHTETKKSVFSMIDRHLNRFGNQTHGVSKNPVQRENKDCQREVTTSSFSQNLLERLNMTSKEETRKMIEMLTVDFEKNGRFVTLLPKKKSRKSSTRISHLRDDIRNDYWKGWIR